MSGNIHVQFQGEGVAATPPPYPAAINDNYPCTLSIWNTADGTKEYFPDLHCTIAYCVSFSPDGKWLAVGSQDTTMAAAVLDAIAGQVVLRLKGDTNGVVLPFYLGNFRMS
jgi:WD40 repeat protein